MPEDELNNDDLTGEEGNSGTPAESQPPAPGDDSQTPKNDNNSNDKEQNAPKGLSEEEVAARVEKARADEKKKAFAKVEKLSAELKSGSSKQAELEKQLKEAQKSLDDIRSGSSTEVETITAELREMRKANEALNKQIEAVADEATARVRQSEVNAHRAARLGDVAPEFQDMVTGDTEEEVDASIAKLKEREEQMKARLLKDSGATPPADPKPKPNLPKPMAPNAEHGRGPSGNLTPQNRENLAKLKGEAYTKKRAELLAAAKQKAGLA